jgi:glutamine phosphoribosylpyrophosphate amidotransferase
VSHNGTVRNAAAIAPQLERRTTNDSEALLQFVAASHGDLGVRVLAAMQQLPPVPHALLVMEPNAIVAARQSRISVIDVNDGTVQARRRGMTEAHPLFYAQREEGTYLCSRRVLDDMHAVEGVMTFRLMEEAAPG